MNNRNLRSNSARNFIAILVIVGTLFTILFGSGHVSALTGNDIPIYSQNITSNENSEGYYEFSNFYQLDGNHIVWMNTWQEKKIENPQHIDTIFLKSLSSNLTAEIAHCPGNNHRYIFGPYLSLSGPFIVWNEMGKNDIFLFNISKQEEYAITRDGSDPTTQRPNSYPAVDKDRLVWSKKNPDSTSLDYDIVMQNLTTGALQMICTEAGDQIDPDISGQKIVWTDKRTGRGDGDIYLFDLETNQEMPVCTSRGLQQFPKVFDNRIVWVEYRDGSPAIYLYNLSSGTEMRISESLFDAVLPKISDRYIVWKEYSVLDHRDDQASRIIVYDLADGHKEYLPLKTEFPSLWDLDKNRILYTDPDNKSPEEGYVHIFVIDTPEVTPSPVLPSAASAQENLTHAIDQPQQTISTQSAPVNAVLPLAAGCIAILLWPRAGHRKN